MEVLPDKQDGPKPLIVTGQKVVNAGAATPLNEGREAVEVTLPNSMHTGQIIMVTKMLSSSDLRFYEFDDGVPAETWHSGTSESS